MRHWTVFILLLSLALGACSVFPGAQEGSSSDEETLPQQQQIGSTPEATVQQFLAHWDAQDYEAMYSLLSPRSQEVYPFEDFQAQYRSAHGEMSFTGVSYEMHEIRQQGRSASAHYDATLHTNLFGDIDDEGRIMRLVQEGDGWQIAWAPMDIINGMTSSITLRSERRFPPRGNIYDRNGDPLVLENGDVVALYLNEQDMSDIDECFNVLARVTLRPVSYFQRLFINYTPEFVAFVAEMDPQQYQSNRADIDSICGAGIDGEFFGSKVITFTGRSYWGHGAAAHITGYLGRVPGDRLSYWEGRGYRSTDIIGLSGVENAMQEELAGTPEQFLRLVEPGGTVLRELGGAVGSDPTSVQLTIDRTMQGWLAQSFNDAWNYSTLDWASVATGGAGVVLDVNTGAILAMHSYPTYDPRIFSPDSSYDNAQDEIQRAVTGDPFLPVGPALSNRALAEQYSPGSTFKIVTAVAAADSQTWDRQRLFTCELEWEGARFGDTLPFREDWRKSLGYPPAGEITISEALTTSCNPFFWEVGGMMYQRQPDLLASYARMFGLGSPLGVANAGVTEAGGNIPSPQSATEALNNAIGQGDTQVTVLQMARVAATIANGGTLYRPYLVEQVGGVGGSPLRERYEPTVVGELSVSDEAIEITRIGMCNVPTDEDLGTSYAIFNDAPYTSCGKTGTAQTGALAPHSWYVAFAPADNPQIAIAVLVTNSREGSEVAAPIVRRFLDNYFGVQWAEFPDWWRTEYIPLDPPQGVSG